MRFHSSNTNVWIRYVPDELEHYRRIMAEYEGGFLSNAKVTLLSVVGDNQFGEHIYGTQEYSVPMYDTTHRFRAEMKGYGVTIDIDRVFETAVEFFNEYKVGIKDFEKFPGRVYIQFAGVDYQVEKVQVMPEGLVVAFECKKKLGAEE